MIRGVGRIARISLVLISLATCSDAPAVAQFQLQEHEATQTFVTSRYIEVRAINTVLSTGVAHMQAEAKSIETGCPGVLAHAPVSSQADELEAELAFAVALAYVEPLREPIDGFASAMFMDHLQWRDRELHDLVYAYVREQASILGLHTPNFCADAKEWLASSYRKTPAGTRQLMTEVRRAVAAQEPNTRERLGRALRRHTTQPERRLLKRIATIEESQARVVKPRLEATLKAVGVAVGLRRPLGGRFVVPAQQERSY